ncbi:ApeA N-terminal domain 1-containing protein [Longispora urticae]
MSVEMRGSWWVPGPREKHKPSGLLTVDEAGHVTLNTDERKPLVAHWTPTGWTDRTDPATAPVVHGTSSTGQAVTLLGVSGYGFPTTYANAVVIGAWLDPPDGQAAADLPVFCGIEVALENLTEWAARSGLRRHLLHTPGPYTDRVLATYTTPPDSTAVLEDGTVVELLESLQPTETRTSLAQTVTFTEQVTVRITPTTPASVNDLLGHVQAVQRLLSFAVGRDCAITSLELRLPQEENGRPDPRAKLHLPLWPRRDDSVKPVEARNMLFTLEQVAFADVMPAWARQHARLQGPIAGLRGARDGVLETRLVSAATAAENLNRISNRSAVAMPKDTFALLRKTIFDAVGANAELADCVPLLKDVLVNRPTLEWRLLDLASSLPTAAVTELLGGGVPGDGPQLEECTAAWAWATRKARNDIGHTSLPKATGTDGTVIAMSATTVMVELALLQLLGFNEAHLVDVVARRANAIARQVSTTLVDLHRESGQSDSPVAGLASTDGGPQQVGS